MLYEYEIVDGKSKFPRAFEKQGNDLLRDAWGTRQQPQIIAARTRYERIPVVPLIEFKNHITCVKRSKKRNLQVADVGTFDKCRFTARLFPFVFRRRVAAVRHRDPTVTACGIISRDPSQTSFERMVEARYFVPATEIALQLESRDGFDARRQARAARYQQCARTDKQARCCPDRAPRGAASGAKRPGRFRAQDVQSAYSRIICFPSAIMWTWHGPSACRHQRA